MQEIPDRGQVVLLSPSNTPSTVPQRYLLALQRLVDGEVAVVVHGEDDDLPRVVEPRRSRHVEPLAGGGHDGGDGVTCILGVGVSRICPPDRPPHPTACLGPPPCCLASDAVMQVKPPSSRTEGFADAKPSCATCSRWAYAGI